jgi:hypothetical protein
MHKILIAAAALAGLALAGPTAAQTVTFNSIPTANTCGYPWVITLQPPPTVSLAPNGAAAVISKVVSGLQTPHGLFTPTANRALSPGTLCFFEACNVGAGTITLTCATLGSAAPKNAAKAVPLIRGAHDKVQILFKKK